MSPPEIAQPPIFPDVALTAPLNNKSVPSKDKKLPAVPTLNSPSEVQ